MLKFSHNFFRTCFRKFWMIRNYFPLITKSNKINTKKQARNISTFDLTTLYTTISHNLVIKVFPEVINFVKN